MMMVMMTKRMMITIVGTTLAKDITYQCCVPQTMQVRGGSARNHCSFDSNVDHNDCCCYCYCYCYCYSYSSPPPPPPAAAASTTTTSTTKN